MITPRIGIQTRSLRQPLRRALQTASELGADGVEIDARQELNLADFSQTAMRQFRKLLEDYRLSVSAIAFPTRRGLDDPEDLQRRVLALSEAMRFAYQVGARVVTHRVAQLPELSEEGEPQSPGFLSHWLESLALLAGRGEHLGARLAIVSGEDPQHQAALFGRLPEGGVGVGLHPAALIHAGHSPAELAERLASRVMHLYAVDGVQELGSGGIEVELGRGSADLPNLLGKLEEHGYQGWVIAERTTGNNPVQDLGNAVAYLRAL